MTYSLLIIFPFVIAVVLLLDLSLLNRGLEKLGDEEEGEP